MEPDQNEARVHLKISGRVQGVYFRASTRYEAQNLRLVGWVRNCPDGSVEVVAEGSRARIEQFISWCRRGPRGARVEDVAIDWQTPTQEFWAFEIRH